MSVFGRIKNLFFACSSQITHSAQDRPLVKVIREQKVRSFVEIGVGNADRAQMMLEAAVKNRSAGPVSYTGIDLFEARDQHAPRGLSLKEVHRKLNPLKAKLRLVPGDAYSALARVANSLAGTEMVVISADQQGPALDRAWYYLPRILAPNATVFVEALDATTGEPILQTLSRAEIESKAAHAKPRRAA